MGILREGQLIQTGTPETIYQQPVNIYTAEITGEVNVFEPEFFQAYFGSTSRLLNGHILIRPEAFFIALQPSEKAVEAAVKRVVFEGSRYLIYLEIAHQLLKTYHHESLPLVSTVFVELRS
jgi:ABC-type Fe3+/spermidine/putrescine transport system ATPase subunit